MTHILAVPTMLNRLLNHPDFAGTDLSSVTNLSYGASIMPEALLRRALELMPGVRFTHRLHERFTGAALGEVAAGAGCQRLADEQAFLVHAEGEHARARLRR